MIMNPQQPPLLPPVPPSWFIRDGVMMLMVTLFQILQYKKKKKKKKKKEKEKEKKMMKACVLLLLHLHGLSQMIKLLPVRLTSL